MAPRSPKGDSVSDAESLLTVLAVASGLSHFGQGGTAFYHSVDSSLEQSDYTQRLVACEVLHPFQTQVELYPDITRVL